MTTIVALFHKPLLDALPDGPVVATLTPEQHRYWRQNPADSVLKYPTPVAFCLFVTKRNQPYSWQIYITPSAPFRLLALKQEFVARKGF